LVSFRFRKGDFVIVDDGGKPAEYEIMSALPVTRGKRIGSELCYDAKNIHTGERKTIYEDEILRLATPVDNSAQLFRKKEN